MNIEVNYVAVLLAAIASFVIGFLWYSPLLFGKMWMKLRGITQANMKKGQKDMGMLYGLSLVVSLFTAYMLAHVMALSLNYYGYPKLNTGLNSAFFMWLGFVMPVMVTATIFSDKKNWKLFGIDTGYQLASLLVMGVVLALI